MPRLDIDKVKYLVGMKAEPPPPFPPGTYTGTLSKVEVGRSDYGKFDYWIWRFEVPSEGVLPHDLHLFTRLDDDWALWTLKQIFAAFGASPETDTDDLLGKPVRLVVSQQSEFGDLVNRIDRVLPLAR